MMEAAAIQWGGYVETRAASMKRHIYDKDTA
jgi:hypothetical protein